MNYLQAAMLNGVMVPPAISYLNYLQLGSCPNDLDNCTTVKKCENTIYYRCV